MSRLVFRHSLITRPRKVRFSDEPVHAPRVLAESVKVSHTTEPAEAEPVRATA